VWEQTFKLKYKSRLFFGYETWSSNFGKYLATKFSICRLLIGAFINKAWQGLPQY
jgi:hypothetical protein